MKSQFQGKNIVLTPMLSREAIILQHLIIQFVLYMYLSEENSGKLQTVSYENRHKKKCSGLQNKSCRLNYIDENCQGLSIHSVLYFLVGERCEDSVSADYIIY